MVQTINARVRKAIRQDTTRVPDSEIAENINRALDYVNRDTEQELVIADYNNATTGDDYFDDLVVFRAAWQIFVFLFQSGTSSKDPAAGGRMAFNVYEQNYLQLLFVDFPLKVEFHNGLYHYANVRSGNGSGGAGTVPAHPNTFGMDNRGDEPGLWGEGHTFEDL